MWIKKGQGPRFHGHYQHDKKGKRLIVLVGFTSKNEVRTVTAESWQMLKLAGWKKKS